MLFHQVNLEPSLHVRRQLNQIRHVSKKEKVMDFFHFEQLDDDDELPHQYDNLMMVLFDDLMATLEGNEIGMRINIKRRVIDFMLADDERIDEFCNALCLATSLKKLSIDHGSFLSADESPFELPKLEITRENSEAISKLVEAIGYIGSRLKYLSLGFIEINSAIYLCPILKFATSKKLKVEIRLPWQYSKNGRGEEMQLIKTLRLPSLEFKEVQLTFVGTKDLRVWPQFDEDQQQQQQHHRQSVDPIWSLLRPQGPSGVLAFERIEFYTDRVRVC